MPKTSTDPFMAGLWTALVADQLGPGGHQTGWTETPVRIRNRFIRAVRPVLGSGAAFQASVAEIAATGIGRAEKTGARAARKASGKRPDPRELQLPLMTRIEPREKPGKTNIAAKRPGR
jgi:hypothetical protein